MDRIDETTEDRFEAEREDARVRMARIENETKKVTPFGTLHHWPESHGAHWRVTADGNQLHEWANRPGSRWPLSVLEDLSSIDATFDMFGDLVELEVEAGEDVSDGPHPEPEVPSDEFDAWIEDVIEAAGFEGVAP